MKTCPHCTTGYPDTLVTCPAHGLLLNEIRDLKPGLVIRSTYRIVRKLGQGGMGSVYLADHLLMGEPRALKFISAELAADNSFTSRFLREVKSLRRLRHPNVVDCGDLERAEDDSLFFSMEYVDGPTLRHVIHETLLPMEIWQALQIAWGIAEGLGAAHRLGMVHRDIKPENILLAQHDGQWLPKIADFGIVATKELSAATRTGASALSMPYAAPEQWLGTRSVELDGRTDFYALGGVLYEMLTGRPALDGESYESWFTQHVAARPKPPSYYRPELANWRGLDELVLQLLEKKREQRPRDVAEVLARMEALTPSHASQPAQSASQPAENWKTCLPAKPEAPAAKVETTGFEPVMVPHEEQVAEAAPIVYTYEPIKTAPKAAGTTSVTVEIPTKSPAQPPAPAAAEPAEEHAEKKSRAGRHLMELLVLVLVLAIGIFSWFRMRADSHVLAGHEAAVASIAFNPDGSLLASGSWDRTIKIWDVATRQPLRTLSGNSGAIHSVAFSPDGHTLASGGENRSIRLWDVATGQLQRMLDGHEAPVLSVAFSPDGRTLASASQDKTIRLWDTVSGQLLHTLTDRISSANAVAFSPDGFLLASGGNNNTVMLWDVTTGQLLRTLTGHTDQVKSVVFSPDGRTMASGALDNNIKIWNPSTGDLLRSVSVWGGPILSLAYSPSGRVLVSGNKDKSAQIWEVASGEPLQSLVGHKEQVVSVAFNRNGALLASGSWDGTIRLWDTSKLR